MHHSPLQPPSIPHPLISSPTSPPWLQVTDQDPEGKYEALSKYARDLTAAARDGKLDPVIGRDEEVRRAIQILSRRTKNNPVLIGEPGVGKTAVAEGLAQRIVAGGCGTAGEGAVPFDTSGRGEASGPVMCHVEYVPLSGRCMARSTEHGGAACADRLMVTALHEAAWWLTACVPRLQATCPTPSRAACSWPWTWAPSSLAPSTGESLRTGSSPSSRR